ncbi:MAG: hypothetical protein AVDCRST_MAG03-3124 [uncultured Rubrobacteraceae bacterium]|uniref:Major facilitator superfamily (MFS) profile domain-containing protein n=1 Tax=uncultured Rubrobacteraceae bacterium TaxID=349277 RepID=A0A6J4PYW1_9ACTN|nr:MAG: hypothetical protein AVDCRST_MAG03-3124 [uncultured Rubrobacteraceae bacterium]
MVVYGYLVTELASQSFPEVNGTAALLAGWSFFSVAVLGRLLEALVLSFLEDRIGHRNTLVILIATGSCATAGIGLLPAYAQIGVVAAIFLFTFRLFQGFTIAGDESVALTFTSEYSSNERRGFFSSFSQVALVGGELLASTVGAILSRVMSMGAVNDAIFSSVASERPTDIEVVDAGGVLPSVAR